MPTPPPARPAPPRVTRHALVPGQVVYLEHRPDGVVLVTVRPHGAGSKPFFELAVPRTHWAAAVAFAAAPPATFSAAPEGSSPCASV